MKKVNNFFLTVVCLVLALAGFSQSQTIRGTVVDDSGNPIIAATVRVTGSQVGTVTDVNGNFVLQVPADGQTFSVSYVGMQAKVVPISNNMTVTLLPDDHMIDDVVVTALGIQKEERTLSYSATNVSGDELTEEANQNILSSLTGKVAGVSINNSSGNPGASSNVIIRGPQSITGSNGVLVVIDGVPQRDQGGFQGTGASFGRDYGNSLTDLDPNNIESVNMLKGTAATALYGTIARNGAMVITTKSGRNQDKLKVSYNGNFETSEATRIPQFQNEFGQGWAAVNYSSNINTDASNENGSWGPRYDGKVRVWGAVYDNSQQKAPYVNLKNNMRDFFTNGSSYSNSLVVSNGNERSNFKISYTNTQTDGILPGSSDDYLDRNNFGFRGGVKTNNDWKFGASINYVKKNLSTIGSGFGDDASFGASLITELYQIPRNISIVDMEDLSNPFNSASYYFTPYARNPYASLKNNQNDYVGDDISGVVDINKDLGENFTITGRFGGRLRNGNENSSGNLVKFIPGSPQDLLGTNPIQGIFLQSFNRLRELNSDVIAGWNKSFNSKNELSVKVGNNVNQVEYNSISSYVTNLTVPGFYDFSNTTGIPTSSDYLSEVRKVGLYGIVDWSYDNWLFVSGTARQDWASTLPKKNRGFFYPSIGVATDLTEAFELPNTFDLVKLRASFGQSGNTPPVYKIKPVSVAAQSSGGFGILKYPLSGQSAFEVGNLVGNPNLKSEQTSEFEIGTAVQIFENRLGLDVAYYNKKTKDLILQVPLDPSSGYTNITTNVGDIRNKGIELAFNAVPLKKNGFELGFDYIYTQNRNKVEKLADEFGVNEISLGSIRGMGFVATPGKALGTFKSSVFRKNDAGQIVVDPATGRPLGSEAAEYVGNTLEKYMMGFSPYFKFKRFSLKASMDYHKGGKLYSYTSSLSNFNGNNPFSLYNDRSPWVVPNSVNEVLDQAGNVTGYVENTTPVSLDGVTSYYNPTRNPGIDVNNLLDKTYFKIRDVALTYRLPEQFAEKIKTSNVVVGFYGRNLLLSTPKSNVLVDPESSTYGIGVQGYRGEYGVTPQSRALGVKLNLEF